MIVLFWILVGFGGAGFGFVAAISYACAAHLFGLHLMTEEQISGLVGLCGCIGFFGAVALTGVVALSDMRSK